MTGIWCCELYTSLSHKLRTLNSLQIHFVQYNLGLAGYCWHFVECWDAQTSGNVLFSTSFFFFSPCSLKGIPWWSQTSNHLMEIHKPRERIPIWLVSNISGIHGVTPGHNYKWNFWLEHRFSGNHFVLLHFSLRLPELSHRLSLGLLTAFELIN